MGKRKSVTITLKLNRDGSMSMRSRGGYDLRKLVPALFEQHPAPLADEAMNEEKSSTMSDQKAGA